MANKRVKYNEYLDDLREDREPHFPGRTIRRLREREHSENDERPSDDIVNHHGKKNVRN
jgi:hypothetical protein